jgi:hypothetical protein
MLSIVIIALSIIAALLAMARIKDFDKAATAFIHICIAVYIIESLRIMV